MCCPQSPYVVRGSVMCPALPYQWHAWLDGMRGRDASPQRSRTPTCWSCLTRIATHTARRIVSKETRPCTQRRHLRSGGSWPTTPALCAPLTRWVDVQPNVTLDVPTTHAPHARQFLALFTWTDHKTVARGSYYDLHRRIVNVLLPHVTTVEALSLAKVHARWSRREVRRLAETFRVYVCSCVSCRCSGTWYAQADWERDCEGNQELSKEQAYNAVFQLIDIWTASLDVAECVALSLAHRPSHAIDLA